MPLHRRQRRQMLPSVTRAMDKARRYGRAFGFRNRPQTDLDIESSGVTVNRAENSIGIELGPGTEKSLLCNIQGDTHEQTRLVDARVEVDTEYLLICHYGEEWTFYCGEGPDEQRAIINAITWHLYPFPMIIPIDEPVHFLALAGFMYRVARGDYPVNDSSQEITVQVVVDGGQTQLKLLPNVVHKVITKPGLVSETGRDTAVDIYLHF